MFELTPISWIAVSVHPAASFLEISSSSPQMSSGRSQREGGNPGQRIFASSSRAPVPVEVSCPYDDYLAYQWEQGESSDAFDVEGDRATPRIVVADWPGRTCRVERHPEGRLSTNIFALHATDLRARAMPRGAKRTVHLTHHVEPADIGFSNVGANTANLI